MHHEKNTLLRRMKENNTNNNLSIVNLLQVNIASNIANERKAYKLLLNV
jgi:hypothetical protein